MRDDIRPFHEVAIGDLSLSCLINPGHREYDRAMITGFHTIIYSDDADATRAFFRDVLRWPSIDAGGGWLIFKTKPSELGVHPTAEGDGERWTTVPFHQSSMMCDDIDATIAELRARGVSVKAEIEDQGFGLVTSFEIPGAGWMLLYQPRHDLAYELES